MKTLRSFFAGLVLFAKRGTLFLAFLLCLAFALLGLFAFLVFACPCIGAKKGWQFASGLIWKAINA